jgi:hypothetical protein
MLEASIVVCGRGVSVGGMAVGGMEVDGTGELTSTGTGADSELQDARIVTMRL